MKWTDGPMGCSLYDDKGEMLGQVLKDSDTGEWKAYDYHLGTMEALGAFDLHAAKKTLEIAQDIKP